MKEHLINILIKCRIPESRVEELISHLDKDPTSIDHRGNLPIEVFRNLSMDYSAFSKDIALLDEYIDTEIQSLSNFEKAQYYHLKAFRLWRSGTDLYHILYKLNSALQLLGETDSHESKGYMGKVCDTYARVLQNQGMYKDAIFEYNRALKYKEQYDDEASRALTYGNIGRLYMEIGDYEKAYHFLRKDAHYIESLPIDSEQQHIMAKLCVGMAICSINLQLFTAAGRYLMKSRSINERLENMYGSIITRMVQASLEIAQKRSEEADKVIMDIEAMLTLVDDKLKREFISWLYKIKADLFALNENFELAYDFYQKAGSTYSERSGHIHIIDRAMFFLSLARVCLELNYNEEAAKNYRQSLELLDMTDEESHRRNVESELEAKLPDSWMLYNSGRFIGHRHVEHLLQNAGSEGFLGEKKHVIILFSDIRDFTPLSENFEPDKLIIFLNAYLASMTRCIEYYGGYVDKFIGDAIMGVFNLFDLEHAAIPGVTERAVFSALLMQEEIKRFNRTLPKNVPNFRVGIGIHYGEVVSGLIGSAQKRSYTVIGDTVNTAARIERLTKELTCNVLISEEVRKLLPSSKSMLIKNVGKHRVKGKSKKLDIYSVSPSG